VIPVTPIIRHSAAPNLARAAEAYATRLRWHVFPCHGIREGRCTCGRADCGSPGKHPLTRRGVHEATRDVATIRRWWQRWPWANVAVATGAASGFWVLDVDPDKGGDEALRELEATHRKLPHTVEAVTGSGGRHILFAHPGCRVPNKVALAPGLDVRGDGGFVVVAPSLHVSGRQYAWELLHHPLDKAVALAPSWLLAMVAARHAGGRQGASDWRRAIAEGVPEGRRNDTLAAAVGGLLLAGVPIRVVLEIALAMNACRFHPPLPKDEVLKVVDSIAGREARRRGGGGRAA